MDFRRRTAIKEEIEHDLLAFRADERLSAIFAKARAEVEAAGLADGRPPRDALKAALADAKGRFATLFHDFEEFAAKATERWRDVPEAMYADEHVGPAPQVALSSARSSLSDAFRSMSSALEHGGRPGVLPTADRDPAILPDLPMERVPDAETPDGSPLSPNHMRLLAERLTDSAVASTASMPPRHGSPRGRRMSTTELLDTGWKERIKTVFGRAAGAAHAEADRAVEKARSEWAEFRELQARLVRDGLATPETAPTAARDAMGRDIPAPSTVAVAELSRAAAADLYAKTLAMLVERARGDAEDFREIVIHGSEIEAARSLRDSRVAEATATLHKRLEAIFAHGADETMIGQVLAEAQACLAEQNAARNDYYEVVSRRRVVGSFPGDTSTTKRAATGAVIATWCDADGKLHRPASEGPAMVIHHEAERIECRYFEHGRPVSPPPGIAPDTPAPNAP